MLVKIGSFPLGSSFLKPTTYRTYDPNYQNLQVSRAEAADMSAKPQIRSVFTCHVTVDGNMATRNPGKSLHHVEGMGILYLLLVTRVFSF